MTGSIDTTVDELVARLPDRLPPVCNVTARIRLPPRLVGGLRWECELAHVGDIRVRVVVHVGAPGSDVGYLSTDPNLLRIFSEPSLRAVLSSGETITVQAIPRVSENGDVLLLHVEAILLARPWRHFGRRLIDYSAKCSRKHYLAVTKGARTEREPPRILTTNGLAGELAHDVIEAAALDLDGARSGSDAFLRNAVKPMTAVRLVALGMLDSSGLVSAFGRGTEVLDVLRRSPALTSLLRDGGPWTSETDAFDRGVTIAPDLVGDRVLVEVKRITPQSFEQQSTRVRQQTEAYLAWAMVRNGLDDVAANWHASLVNVHPDVPESQRVLTIMPRRELVGERVYRRHRLLTVLDGEWLPAPLPDECSFCEFSEALSGEEGLAAICEYYCQTERGWGCRSVDQHGTLCPLYGICDQHSRYEAYERLDEFNRLRRMLLIEEEEAEIALDVIQRAPKRLGPFRVAPMSGSGLSLRPDGAMALLDAAIPGTTYNVHANGRILAQAKFRRLRDGHWRFVADHLASVPEQDTRVELSLASVTMPFPVRTQLAELDRLQRMGEAPFAIRHDAPRVTGPELSHYRSLSEVPTDAACVIVDNADPFKSREVATEIFDSWAQRNALVLTGPHTDFDFLPSDVAQLDEFSAVERTAAAAERLLSSLQRLAHECSTTTRLAVPWDLFFGGLMDPFIGSDRFSTVIVLDAHEFPLLGLRKCFQLAGERVILSGSALAAGPWAESATARSSTLFQNGIRLLIETGGYVAPEHIRRFAVVRVPAAAAVGLKAVAGGGTLVENTPVELRLVDGVTDRMNALDLVADVDTARPQQNRLRLKVALAEGETVSLREARQRMRQISPEAIERFRPGSGAGPNTSIWADSSLLGFPVKLEADVESLPAIQLEKHQVILSWSESSLPMAVSESLSNSAEAATLVDIAAADRARRFIATSPYRAQCRLLAEKGYQQNLTNLRVVFGERLGHRSVERGTELLISLVASDRHTTSGWPLNELGHVLPLFLGAWSKISVVCSPFLATHHPLIRQLARANES